MDTANQNPNVVMLTQLMSPLPDGERTYSVFADGIEISPKNLFITGQGGEVWMLGVRKEGWQGMLYRENGGGGNVTLPWARLDDGNILVGLIEEHRPNMGNGFSLCAMGGALDTGETRAESQEREADEEAGLNTKAAQLLPGPGVVQDRLFYVADVTAGEGIRCFELQFDPSLLEECGGGTWHAKLGVVNHKRESQLVFVPIWQAVQMASDAMALCAIAKLAAKLATE